MYMNLVLLVVLVAIFSMICYLLARHHSRFVGPNRPPGSVGLPLVGETLEFLSNGWKGHPEKFVLDRIAKYSSNVFKTSLFGEPFAVFAGSACNKFVFSNENKLVSSWWPDSVNKIFPSSLQSSSQEESKKMRKLLPQFFKPEALQRYVGTMDSIAHRHFAASWDNREEVMVFPLAKMYTFWIASRLFISVEEPGHVERLGKTFNKVTAGIIAVPMDLPGTPFRRGINASNTIRKELLSIIKQRKLDLADGKASPTQDILSHMLLTTNEDGKFMAELDIADKILGLLIGGHDTASAACTFIVKFLAELPHIYRGVYQEQMEIAKSKTPGELLNWEDLQKMKYSWNVACEVMRLAPPVQGAFREVINDFIFNGFSIPKGWKLYWSANSTHKNPECFPQPEKFDPSRFEGSGPAPYAFVPFGGGPRMCPGKEYARLEILVFMHNLVKRFNFELVHSQEKIIVDPMPMPAKGLPIRLYAHKT